jgi:hypothetical protein
MPLHFRAVDHAPFGYISRNAHQTSKRFESLADFLRETLYYKLSELSQKIMTTSQNPIL